METSDIISIIIAAAAFFTAVVGPLLSSLIQCRHESKMYEKRFKAEHEHEVIERYLKTAGRFVFSFQHQDVENFGESCAEIFMYAPKELWEDIRNLNSEITKAHFNTTFEEHRAQLLHSQTLYFSLCEKFSDLRLTSTHKRHRSRRKRN